jgi:hypothetical protein
VEWKLRVYLGWKGKLRRRKEDGQGAVGSHDEPGDKQQSG